MAAGIETTGTGEMDGVSADAVRSAGTGGGGGARRLGEGPPYETDVLRGRLPEADTDRGTPTRMPSPVEPLGEAPVAREVRGTGATGAESYERARGPQTLTLGMRFQDASMLCAVKPRRDEEPNAPWMACMRWVETDMVNTWEGGAEKKGLEASAG